MDASTAKRAERTGWSTPKAVALYERIARASSNESDLVLDPCCGCSTTLVAAERRSRRWIGVNIDHAVRTWAAGRRRRSRTSSTAPAGTGSVTR